MTAMALVEVTPLYLPVTPLPSPNTTTKRLRSCLSPTRRHVTNPFDTIPLSQSSTISSSEPCLTRASSPMTSRTSSFSSVCDDDRWRKKNVRWEEEQGCVMAAVFPTWSADDYDRSPLAPPAPEERACILPARNSRCISPSSAPLAMLDEFNPISPLSLDISNVQQEWDECMDRRQLFAQQMMSSCPGAGLEGYTSLSATLATMLGEGAMTEKREVSTPVGSPQEESVLEAAMGLGVGMGMGSRHHFSHPHQHYEERGRPSLIKRIPPTLAEEDDEEEDDDEHGHGHGCEDEDDEENVAQPSLETVMAALRAFRSGPGPLLGTDDEQRDRD